MSTTRKTLVPIGLAMLILCASLAAGPAAVPGFLEIPFELDSERSAILLKVTIDGQTAVFVLDTGASTTIVSPRLAGVDPNALRKSRFSQDGPGIRAEGIWSSVDVTIGARTFRSRMVGVMDLAEVSRVFRTPIGGLIGQDLLREFGRVAIDFRSLRLRLGGES